MFKTAALDNVANEFVDEVGVTPGTRYEANDQNIRQVETADLVESSGQTLKTSPDMTPQSGIAAAKYGGGGGDFYEDGGAANAYVLTRPGAFKDVDAYFDGQNIVFKPDNANTGASTINVSGIGVVALELPGGVALAGGEVPAGLYAVARYSGSGAIFELMGTATSAPRGYIDGLILSNDADTEHDISVSPGVCKDSTNADVIRLAAAIVKRIDAAWAVGSGNGGLFSGSVAVDTWYHVFAIIKDSDRSVDVGFDTSVSAANIPAGYTNFRRIGSVLTNGSSNIINFIQMGDTFWWKLSVEDVDSTTLSSSATDYTLSAPPVDCEIILTGAATDADAYSIYIQDKALTDWVPAQRPAAGKVGQIYNESNLTTDTAGGASAFRVRAVDSQVTARASAAIVNFTITTHGWMDMRGRDV